MILFVSSRGPFEPGVRNNNTDFACFFTDLNKESCHLKGAHSVMIFWKGWKFFNNLFFRNERREKGVSRCT